MLRALRRRSKEVHGEDFPAKFLRVEGEIKQFGVLLAGPPKYPAEIRKG